MSVLVATAMSQHLTNSCALASLRGPPSKQQCGSSHATRHAPGSTVARYMLQDLHQAQHTSGQGPPCLLLVVGACVRLQRRLRGTVLTVGTA